MRYRTITLRYLKILKTVTETGNFTRAAEALYITQSTISHAVKELKEEVDMLLFERLKKRVCITENSCMLLEESLPLLSSFRALKGRLGRLECQTSIRIVSSITIASWKPSDILNRSQEKWPKLPVQVKIQSATGALQALGVGGAELAFLEGTPLADPYVCAPSSPYALGLVCSPVFLEGREPRTSQELHACPPLLQGKDSAVRDTFGSSLYLHELIPTLSRVGADSGAPMEAARAGLGIAVLPEELVRPGLETGILIQLHIPGLTLTNPMNVMYHKEERIIAPLRDLLLCVSESKQS